MNTAILGIESSCDESAAAIYDVENGLMAHAIYSQVAVHADYGGVVPELASRDHVRKLTPLIERVRAEAGHPGLAGIAYTRGPGLVGALLVGASLGVGLSEGLDVPLIGVHHMEGHLLSPRLEDNPPDLPYLALLVSGGHTLLVYVAGIGHYQIIGRSVDDAVGEAFDKTAKTLGLGYPGGPAVACAAETGDPTAYDFPRPMTRNPGMNFSFSGLKTAVKLAAGGTPSSQEVADIAASFQQAVVDTLTIKCHRALDVCGASRLIVAGGVGANQRLRDALGDQAATEGFEVFYPRSEFCTDNAAMIAYTGYCRQSEMKRSDGVIDARARWPLTDLAPPGVQLT